jgi:2-haloacid dehalogenase
MRKPFPEIYHLALDRYGFKASETVFIDDNHRNIAASSALGIQSILFKNPDDLERDLKEKGIRL